MARRVEAAWSQEGAIVSDSEASWPTAVVQVTTWPNHIHQTQCYWCLGGEHGEREDAADWR